MNSDNFTNALKEIVSILSPEEIQLLKVKNEEMFKGDVITEQIHKYFQDVLEE